ncbi:MAG: glutaredoxin-like protein NrdH [Roseibium sp.]|uniref:glutaredoxin-like protein NrdH n=1 Tax=Roseibium sp. TaxID=1936156 RepID=UPI0032967F1F
MKITVYSKPACVQCTATTRAMDAKGIAYDVVDLTQDAAAMERVTKMGYRQAPVIVAGATDEMHWAGFQPGKIDLLVAQMATVEAPAPTAEARLTA